MSHTLKSPAPELPGAPRLTPGATVGQRWRFQRDLVIYLAHRRNGLSQRLLAQVFDLPRSRISAIVRSFPGRVAGTPGLGQPADGPDD